MKTVAFVTRTPWCARDAVQNGYFDHSHPAQKLDKGSRVIIHPRPSGSLKNQMVLTGIAKRKMFLVLPTKVVSGVTQKFRARLELESCKLIPATALNENEYKHISTKHFLSTKGIRYI